MDTDTREISSISFGVYSPTDILNMSCCKIDSSKRAGQNTVYDPRMGPLDDKICETCKEKTEICPGHFGHIEFHEPIIHPLYFKEVVNFLKCICTKCNRLLIDKEHIYLDGLNRFNGNVRFLKILEKISKVVVCCHPNCGSDQPEIKHSASDESISQSYIDKGTKLSIGISVSDILKIFDNVTDGDVRLLGFDPELVHPRNFIFVNFPVMPPVCRPYVMKDGNTFDDDFTNQYIEIVKANNRLEDPNLGETQRQKAIQTIKFRVSTTYNNSKGRAKHTTNGRPIKSIKRRIAGKDGQVRDNLQGKRCEQTGRTVIGPDPTLRMGELAMPVEMANILTTPVMVTKYNIDELQQLVNKGRADYVISPDKKHRINLKRYFKGTVLIPNDVIIRGHERIIVKDSKELIVDDDMLERDGQIMQNIKHSNRIYKLSIGWIVERKLQTGDWALLNRQPTLHRGSMQAMKIIVRGNKTLRINLSICKSFNADFDGDEMNVHIPQTLEAQAELRMLSSAECNIMSAQASKSNTAVVQDSLLGAYRMTKGIIPIRKDQFFNICMKIDMSSNDILLKIKQIKNVFKKMGKWNENVKAFHGHGIVSMILPNDFSYNKENKANPNEPVVRIYKGVMYEGTIDKAIIGSSHNSIIQTLHKEYSPETAAAFVDGIQFTTNAWLLISGFSVGIKDCLIPNNLANKKQEISDNIQKCLIEAEGIKETTSHNNIRELRINTSLSKAKDIGFAIAKSALIESNNFLSTVNSGSKGDFFNIAQITGLLGQQNLRGARVPLFLNNGKRSLPHYPFGEMPVDMEYESRGFIANSFIYGLNPRQFYFHAMAAREGVSDTAMGTATSGYMQRRIVKLLEDVKVEYDGTVRDVNSRIIQCVYGDDGLDPTHTVKVGHSQEPIDISRLVYKLNVESDDEDFE